MTQDDERRHAARMAWTGDEIEIEEYPDTEQYASPAGGSIDLGAEVDTILDQLGLADDGLIGQLVDLSLGNEAWRKEARNARGEWTGGSAGSASRRPAPARHGVDSRVAARRVQANRQAASSAVAERVAEEKARQALDQARAEVERVARQLQEEAKTAEEQKHRTKLAFHAVLVMAGAILAAIMVHFDVSPALAAFGAAMPLLTTELVDWRKKLLWTPPRSRRLRRPVC